MQNGRINSPSLDLACPQAKTEIEKHVHMLWERGVDKKKYGHRSNLLIIITATNLNIKLYHTTFYHVTSNEQVTIHHNIEV